MICIEALYAYFHRKFTDMKSFILSIILCCTTVFVLTNCEKELPETGLTETYPIDLTLSQEAGLSGQTQTHEVSFSEDGSTDFILSLVGDTSLNGGAIKSEYHLLIEGNARWKFAINVDGGLKPFVFKDFEDETIGTVTRRTNFYHAQCGQEGFDDDFPVPNSIVYAGETYANATEFVDLNWAATSDQVTVHYEMTNNFGYEYVDSLGMFVANEWVIPSTCQPIANDEWVYVPFTNNDETTFGLIKLQLRNQARTIAIESVEVYNP